MTSNQINYLKVREDSRTHRVQEGETRRANMVKEAETMRANLIKESETERHNREAERLEDKRAKIDIAKTIISGVNVAGNLLLKRQSNMTDAAGSAAKLIGLLA